MCFFFISDKSSKDTLSSDDDDLEEDMEEDDEEDEDEIPLDMEDVEVVKKARQDDELKTEHIQVG